MIFVTVGTHEQPFDRLIKYIDDLKEKDIIKDDVIIQTGYSTYEPKYCTWSKMLPFSQMVKNVEEAEIIITHGGPSSFIMPLQIGKIPIVVPRQKKFDEHVNDHQLEFVKKVAAIRGNLIVIEDIKNIKDKILNYSEIIDAMPKKVKSNNIEFCRGLETIVNEIIRK